MLAGATYLVLGVATTVLWGTDDVFAADPRPDVALIVAALAGVAAIAVTAMLLSQVGRGRDSAPTGIRHVGALRVLALFTVLLAGPIGLAILLLSALEFGAGDFQYGR